ncbi:MAG TPA: zinc-binding alcohol dehydrogenase [Anaerolineales bacterium]|nr:zinc-binding alcohol dehydrogenase [Anaerolineales bacterium]
MGNHTLGAIASRSAVWFTAPKQVALQTEYVQASQPEQVWVQGLCSAISAGTELLIYRGQAPQNLSADSSIAALAGDLSYPLKYGYSWVGVLPDGERVFSFQPHHTGFWGAPTDWQVIPAEISTRNAVFLPNMETAVNLVQDGAPLLGERVLVLGLGVVGQLVLGLLGQFPLAECAGIDSSAQRCEVARLFTKQNTQTQITKGEYDLVFELTGNPAALENAIDACGFGGRVVVGSWYGNKVAPIALGGHFHRNRIQLISSQVSTIAPVLSGRWSKARRFDIAWQQIIKQQPAQLISHTLPISQASSAYALLDQASGDVIQVVLDL